ncbi:winged helix-turn-helix transcriptional regulator [Pseudomonas aeruginosa]|uniref:winged helix-turn-helix transcriptional regulator n=1 Tax=Pseudomonas aeruginosa TaxID=287 RepID=UPI001E4516FE|nr:helix-turn-helix domain-containing protein [Pseudomonas aeruginosa]
MILRDAFQGLSKFDEFEKNLGISANILARRLKHLTAEGLFERRRYNDHPPRFEYVLTDKGRDFYPVAIALFAWGNRNLAPNEIAMRLGDKKTGRERTAVIIDADTGEAITPENRSSGRPRRNRGNDARHKSREANKLRKETE